LGAKATIETNRQNIEESRAKEVRDKRGEIYPKFLENANAFNVASADLRTEQQAAKRERRAPGASVEQAWQHARYEFRGSMNDVSVFGSSQAWAAAVVLSSTLPSAAPVAAFPEIKQPTGPLTFSGSYTAFLGVYCKEVPAVPRGDCDDW
jgi:hypothetical protein